MQADTRFLLFLLVILVAVGIYARERQIALVVEFIIVVFVLCGIVVLLHLFLWLLRRFRAMYLIRKLGDKNPRVRARARGGLKGIGEPALPIIRRALSHRERLVRAEAINLLWLIGGRGYLKDIVNMLYDENEFVRCTALVILGRIGERSVLPVIAEAVKRFRFGLFRLLGLEVMWQFDEGLWQPALMQELREIYGLPRASALDALGRLRRSDATKALIGLMETDTYADADGLIACARQALGETSRGMAIDNLKRCFETPDSEVHHYVLAVIKRITSELFPAHTDPSTGLESDTLMRIEQWCKWSSSKMWEKHTGNDII